MMALGIPALLAAQEGSCVIFSTDGSAFYVGLDNKFQNPEANTNVKITGIPEGDYWVTILFNDTNKKAFKSNVRVLEKKETAYIIEQDGGSWKLKQYSSVPSNQVQALNTKQTTLPYNQTGVVVRGLKSAKDISDDMIVKKTEINRVHGAITNDPKSKRVGKFSGSSSDLTGNSNTTEPTAQQPEQTEGTTIIKKYIETTNADGTKSIVEEATTLIKEIVVRNGQRQMRTKRSVTHTPTDLSCLPLEKEAFIALKKSVEEAANEQRLDIAQNGIKDKCMTSGQIKAIGDMILTDVDQNAFAMTAKPICADPKNFPYTTSAPVSVNEKKEEVVEEIKDAAEEVVDETPIKEEIVTKEKSKAELKAELKALKQKQKAEKAAAKAKAKAEKAAAKAKAKAEKAAAKKKQKAEKAAKKK